MQLQMIRLNDHRNRGSAQLKNSTIVFMSPLQMRRSSPLETLDVIMPQAGCCVAVGLEYRCTYIGVGTPVHLGLSVSWIACTACYNNIVQLGCRLIA